MENEESREEGITSSNKALGGGRWKKTVSRRDDH